MTKPVISLVDIKTAPADIREAAEKHLAKGYAMTNEKRTLLHNRVAFEALEGMSYAVSAELNKRSTQLGRNDRYIAPIIKRPPTAFRLGDITENYENPVRQAEYLYSLIESEVK